MARRLSLLLGVFLSVSSPSLLAADESDSYLNYKIPGLDKPAIRQVDILPLLQELQKSPLLRVEEIARSYEGRPISSVSIGRGDTRVMMWSQMHGDEPTATTALFDLLAFITAPEQAQWRDGWMDDLTLVMVPMLNPDGAERDTRHNAQSFDVNRDAKALQSPEGRALMSLAKSFKPEFGFNLHDQNRHYGVGQTDKMATISVLAPAYNEAREVNASRARAMKLIGLLVQRIDPSIGDHIAKYDDTYAWRAFGDTFAEMGISTILIESGAHPNDPNRQVARRMNFEMLVAAIDSIASGSYQPVSVGVYNSIPFNRDEAFVDVKIDNIRAGDGDKAYRTDIAINHRYGSVSVVDVGDLSNKHGALSVDAGGAQYQAAKAYQLEKTLELTDRRYLELLRSGYGYFVGDSELLVKETQWPVVVNPANLEGERPARRQAATFLLRDEAGVRLAVLNGGVVDVRKGNLLALDLDP
ncbi:M14 metallopeptidase family protein [Microbulbifer sp.]|uniref:M14 family metallopeptidase n=1 Tax=Microbulbifer sp. TaxID=1908541 RepID=UPI002F959299